jgi:outer membrane receptor protein involved in Fe transport
MTYFTFSQGFRPGGFNRNGGSEHGPGSDGEAQFIIPKAYSPDTLANYEVGWKTDWHLLDRDFQWNTALYRENWNNVQITFFNPNVFGNLFFDDNGQNFRINGVETSLVAQLWQGLRLRGSAAWNSSEQTNSPQIINNNPASVNFGKPITEVCPSGPTSCTPVANLFGPRGSPTSNSPPIRYTLRLRYDFPIKASAAFSYLNDAVGHLQFGAVHQGHSFTQAGSSPLLVPGAPIENSKVRFENPAYTTYDASIGIAAGNWEVTAYGENLFNSNVAVFTSTESYIVSQTPLRPRVLGLRFNYNF